jgi:acyl-CoA thioesterase
MTAGPPSFVDVTAVEPVSGVPGRFAGRLPPDWNTPVGVHGGMLVGIATRAGLAGLAREDLRIRALHALFLAPPTHDLTFDVETIRQGRGSAHVRVTATDGDGTPALDLTMVLTSDRPSPAFLDATPPDVPPAHELPSVPGGSAGAPGVLTPPPLFDHLEIRTAVGIPPWSPNWVPDQPGRHVRWSRWNVAPRSDRDAYDPLSLLPMADLPGPSIWQRFGPDEPMMFFMSLDLSLRFLETVTDEWILTDIRARRMGEGHVHVETDLWSAGRLVATSAQTMMVRLPASPTA